MVTDSAPMNLTHHFLIAMPSMRDDTFGRSVIYLCEHSERGALGLIINKPSDINLKGLFDKVDLHLSRPDLNDAPVFQGGPVQTERGFVLHEAVFADKPKRADKTGTARGETKAKKRKKAYSDAADGKLDVDESQGEDESVYASTMTIPGGLEMTTSRDVLEAIATGAGPRRVLVSLGYAAWGEGQLESELAENVWLTVGADVSVIFDTPIEQRYDRALSLLGLEAWTLSPEAGHA